MAKVSICIPAYNQVKYLKRAIDSVLNQTYTDYEIVITDDSPTDIVFDLVQEYQSQGNIQYYKNAIPLGSPENWNEAIRVAKGEYIKIMHHDDWFTYSNSLQIFVDLMENNRDATIGVVSSRNIKLIDNSTININTPSGKWIAQIETEPLELICGNFIGSPSAVIYKNGSGIHFDKNLKWFVDIEFYSNLLKNSNNIIAVSSLDAISIGIGEFQITRECENNGFINMFEFFYFLNKWNVNILDSNKNILNAVLGLCSKFNCNKIEDIRAFGYEGVLPNDIENVFKLNKKDKESDAILLLHKIKKMNSLIKTVLKPFVPQIMLKHRRILIMKLATNN